MPPAQCPRPRAALVPCQAEEFYVCIYAAREGDYVLFHHEGGVDVGDVDAKAKKLLVGVDKKLNPEDIKKHLLVHAPEDKKELSEGVCRDAVRAGSRAGRRALGSAGTAEWPSLWGWEAHRQPPRPPSVPRRGAGWLRLKYATRVPHLAPVWLGLLRWLPA